MQNIPHGAHRVNLNLAYLQFLVAAIVVATAAILAPLAAFGHTSYGNVKRYLVPGTETTPKPLTAAFGYFADGILRSVRSRGGRLWGDDGFALNIEVMNAAIADGLDTFEIVITYKTKNITITYSTDFDTLQQHGTRVLGVSGWELSMPLHFWSIDGAAPVGPAVVAEPVPTVEQPMLFDFAEPVKRYGGAY